MDCALINMLIGILEILNNNMAMATVCSVPLSFIFLRGQGIKIFSLVSKACKENNYVIPVLKPKPGEEPSDDDTYEGAICFTPDIGFYDVPITVLDYGSLYPSSMIDQNMSHETIILDDKYRGLKGYKYNEVWYKSDPTLEKPDTKVTFAIPEDGKRGIVPTILQYLLDARNSTRAKQKGIEDASMFAILEGLQLAYKVTANSLYGQIGAKTSPVHLKAIAASTTARGREMLEFGRDYVEKDFKTVLEKYLSVVDKEHDEFLKEIKITHPDVLKPTKMLLLFWQKKLPKEQYELFKKQLDNPKEKIIINEEDQREFSRKDKFYESVHKMFFKQYGFDINPKIIYGDSVTGDTPLLVKINDKIRIVYIKDLAEQWEPYPGFKANDTKLLMKERSDLDNYEILCGPNNWVKIVRVIRHMTYKKIYRVTTNTSSIDVTEDHSLINDKGILIKPENLNMADKLFNVGKTIDNFNIEYDEGKLINIIYNKEYKFIDKLELVKYFWVLSNKGYNVIVKDNILLIVDENIDDRITSKNLLYENYEDYVYDIETEAGVFHAGVGDLVIKNTDSNFIDWKMMNKESLEPLKGKHLVGLGIELGKLVEKNIKALLPFPHKWNYEKTFYPFCILAKKRYIGMKFEFTDDHSYLSFMGIVLKRRDNARIVKKVISGLIDIMMEQVDGKDNLKIISFMREQVEKILSGGFPLDDFELSKTLKGSYALSNDNMAEFFKGETKKQNVMLDDKGWYILKNNKRIHNSILTPSMAHVALAERVRLRDPGNAFNLNDRVPFIYIEKKKKKGVKLLQGDIVETPDYIRANNLKVDYLFYITNQIMNPAVQLLEVLMPNPQALFDEYIQKEEDRKNGIQGLEKWGIVNVKAGDKNKKILEKPKEKQKLGKSLLPRPPPSTKRILALKD